MHSRQVQYRLMSERLAGLLRCDMRELPDDEVARVFIAAYVVLKQHKIDKHGRCRHCRRWLRRKPCTVYLTYSVAMTQSFRIIRPWLEDQ